MSFKRSRAGKAVRSAVDRCRQLEKLRRLKQTAGPPRTTERAIPPSRRGKVIAAIRSLNLAGLTPNAIARALDLRDTQVKEALQSSSDLNHMGEAAN